MIWKEFSINFIPLLIFLLASSLVHWSLKSSLVFFWLGGFLGTYLIDIDHLVYILVRRPYELTSKRFLRLWQQRRWRSAFLLLIESHRERRELIAHTVSFQIILIFLTFWILTSSASLFSKGLILGLFLHTLVDQAFDFPAVGDLRNWFWQFKSLPEKQVQVIYFWVLVFLFLIFSLLWV